MSELPNAAKTRVIPRIQTADHPGLGLDGLPRPTEDRIVVLDNAVVVLDGASSHNKELPSAGWYAGLLAESLAEVLTDHPQGDLAELLFQAIAKVTREQGLEPGHSPSSTVAMVRWTSTTVDALVLADSPVVVRTREKIDVLSDDRLANLQAAGKLAHPRSSDKYRNAENGFWVAAAEPEAARRACRKSWPLEDVETVLALSDGVSIGVDEYHLLSWAELMNIAREQGAYAVLDLVRKAEDGDPDRQRWPRAKHHDDQALVVVDFTTG
jgi:hypothetical protein